MLRSNLYNYYYDFCAFVSENRRKYIFAILIFLGCAIFGIKNALSIIDIENYNLLQNCNLVVYLMGKRGIISYFFTKILGVFLVLLLIHIFSFRRLISFLIYVVFGFYIYLATFYIGLYFVLLKFSALPICVFCIIPCLFIEIFLLLFVCVSCLNRGMDITLCGHGQSNCIRSLLVKNAKLYFCLSVNCLLETLLVFLLSIGVVL